MELIVTLVNRLQERLSNLHHDSIDNHNIFVYYESQITLQKFQNFCKKYEKKEGRLTEEIIKELGQIMKDRLPHIARTAAASNYYFTNKVETGANILCNEVSEIYFSIAGKFDYQLVSNKNIFKPSTDPKLSIAQAYENLAQSVIKNLRDNPELNNILAQSIKIDMTYIAKQVKRIINHIEENKNQNDPVISRESDQTISKIKELLETSIENEEAFIPQQLDPYVKLLDDRWEAVDGNDEISYLTNPTAKVNRVCRSLSNYVSLMGCRYHYINKDPQDLYMPTPPRPKDEKAAFQRLHKYVYADLKNRDELIAEMDKINPKKWKSYVEGFELEKFNALLTNNQTMDSFFKAEDTYNEDEKRSRMLLICVYESYKKNRVLYPYHKTIAGSLFQYVTRVYNIEDKMAAANDSQDEFMTENGLVNFEQALDDLKKLLKHKGALLDSEMADFTKEVFKAIKKLPQKKNENLNVEKPEYISCKV